MARQNNSESVFLRYDGGKGNRKDVHFRINPQAVRFQQAAKASTQSTLGGYFYERINSKNPEYNSDLADLTVEGTTGIAYQKELERIKWIWDHSGDRKADGSPVDIYIFLLIDLPKIQDIVRSTQQAYLIFISNFAYDISVQSPFEIKFTLRTKVLKDLFWQTSYGPEPNDQPLPNLSQIFEQARLTKLDGNSLKNPLRDLTQIAKSPFTKLPL